jgi:hypothetical protein
MVRYLINPPQNFKQAHKLLAKLLAGQPEGQIQGGEPDPVAWKDNRSLTAVTVGLFLVPTHGVLETSVRSVPGLLGTSKPLVHRRYGSDVKVPGLSDTPTFTGKE